MGFKIADEYMLTSLGRSLLLRVMLLLLTMVTGAYATENNDELDPAIQDYDQDGVENFKDVCPKTPLGLPVNALGCPPDADKDGVANVFDRCGDTHYWQAVNAEGCPESSSLSPLPMEHSDEVDMEEGAFEGENLERLFYSFFIDESTSPAYGF